MIRRLLCRLGIHTWGTEVTAAPSLRTLQICRCGRHRIYGGPVRL